ncbi:transcriptional regulator [Streptomyces ruber]|uniref:Transcriptional regulator n=2 Tax=Streptomyces TaxID=1883 RepID=A0A918ERT6_9ACTN|nr:GAF and ANTAR domain-containing protein [Streptomyces ruber]GGQ53690.1 transcriptional regulator [Streptomyces ruber]
MPSTERETLVAEAVLDLAARTGDCDVLDLLQDLTAHLVTLLGIRAAGAMIMNGAGQVDHLAASDEDFRRLEEGQLALDEGPCVDSTRSGAVLTPVVLHPPGTGLRRWPRFAPRALRVGITSVAAVPLRVGEHTVGAVDLMGAGPFPPTRRDLRLAQSLADAAGAWLRQRKVLRTKDEVLEQLQTALNTRVVIEQAKGALAARLGIGVEESFVLLRSHARSRRQKLSELAARVAQGAVPSELDARP